MSSLIWTLASISWSLVNDPLHKGHLWQDEWPYFGIRREKVTENYPAATRILKTRDALLDTDKDWMIVHILMFMRPTDWTENLTAKIACIPTNEETGLHCCVKLEPSLDNSKHHTLGSLYLPNFWPWYKANKQSQVTEQHWDQPMRHPATEKMESHNCQK